MSSDNTPLIRRGTCHAVFAFEVANAIDLDEAERRVAESQRQIVRSRRAPSYFEYRPAPLRVTWGAPAVTVGGFSATPSVRLVMYDFGAVSLSFAFPLEGPVADLVALAAALRGAGELLAEARRHVHQLMDLLKDAAHRPRVADVVEDYVIFELAEVTPSIGGGALVAQHTGLIAQILRAERRPLSDQETRAATALQASFGPDDVTMIDTDAALVADPEAADVRAVIEFANAQLLEMRFLDQQLDDALDSSYQLLARRTRGGAMPLRSYDRDARHVAQLQIDAAILFERVTNALKLIGEQYLTRIYTLVSQRFHLSEWDASISRKLETAESIYSKLADRATARRMEILEWIIIALIALEIVLPFVGVGGH